MGVERNLRLHLRPLPKEDLWGQRVSTLDQRGDGVCLYLSCKCLTRDSFCLLLGVGQNCGLRTKDGRSPAAPDLQRRQREGQVIHFDAQLWCRGKCLVTSVMVTGVLFLLSPTPHLHFSIKHPHTLSWEYYKMFQCKAHLVMRLIENRISMEFMLQVALHSSIPPPPTRTSIHPSIHPFKWALFASHQVFNKLLSLASTASSQKYQSQMWSQMLVSTHGFLKSISNVSGKDIGPLIKQWVYPSLSRSLHLFEFPADFSFLSCCSGTHRAFLCAGVKCLINSTIQGDLRTKNQAPKKPPTPHPGSRVLPQLLPLLVQPAALSLSMVPSGTVLNLIRINFSSELNQLCWIPGYWAPVWAGCVLSAAFAFLHLFSVFNSSRSETRALWWNSLAVLPSIGRGMCSSWRSVRTTHHLELRNMWWALRRSVWECVSIKQEQLKAGEPNTAKSSSSDVHTLWGM